MDEFDKTIIKGKIRIVTPVHIGGTQEKHLQRGLDYIDTNEGVFFLDEKKLIGLFGITKYSEALAQGRLDELCGSLQLIDFSTKVVKNISGEIGTDIKTNIKNTLSGKPIIPGSSLKGSLRSVFYNFIIGDGSLPIKESDVFGEISEDIFRYMIVSDIEFNETNYINTKTFNLTNNKGNIVGGWKHGQNNGESFNSKGFTFPHEVIRVDDMSEFNIVINKKALSIAVEQNSLALNHKKVKHNDYIDQIFSGSETDIFKIIQTYTDSYLKAELSFFEKYEADKSGIIVEELNRLVSLNQQSPLLRLGLGSGFHAMTGDTIHDTHDIDAFGNRSRGLNQGKDSAKSRKIAFKGSGENLRLYPMGFVQLMSENHYKENYQRTFELRKQQILEQNRIIEAQKEKQAKELAEQIKRKELELQQQEQRNRELAEEAKKPKMTEATLLKKAKKIDAIVTGQSGTRLLFKPFVTGFENKEYDVSYPAGMEIGTIITISAQLIANGKILQITGGPVPK